jgi:hypothetical protein
MSQDIKVIQDAVMAFLEQETGAPSYDTDYPDAKDEPTENDVLIPYNVVRSNSPNRTPDGEGFGGPRWGEEYTLIDVLSVAASPDEARDLAYAADGVSDVLLGYKPNDDSGQLTHTGGGMVYVAGDNTASKPRRFIARNSFRLQTNLQPG